MDLRAAWSPDGGSVVFERQENGRSRLFRVGADGTDLVPLDACNDGAETVQGRPAFFDADDVVFVNDRDGDLALWRFRGDAAERLTEPGSASDYGPAPLADGAVVFFRSDPDGPSRLLRLDPDGGLRALGQEGDQPWPTGGGLVFHSDRDGTDAVWRLDGGGAVRVTPAGLDEGTSYVTPMPSPGGGWVAFARADGGVSQVWLMRPDGRDRQRLTDGEPHSFPAWSPDGGSLVVTRGRPTSDDAPTGDLWRLTLSFP
ncbi:TolB family protein [Rubrivirga litoralis]|uniref:WD40 repeat protein n=1 Tax=Rubrivirga litoralis TaxID=3075598 RepID=A0ABU3BQ92_9BACT|nr:hypothetical protein [Rubrivirga sp. F394]MDT0631459.1 hypothetical protein [Rubrivirga sp. F394]